MNLKKYICAGVLACATMGAQAGIINGDFSDGLNGWTVTTSVNGQAGVFGEKLLLTSDASISQNLSWLAGDELSFEFLPDFTEEGNSTLPVPDFVLFSLKDMYENIITEITIADLYDHETTVQKYTHVFDSTENGSFYVGIYDFFDNARNSRLQLDNFTFETSAVNVPEPSALAIMLLGISGLMVRKKLAV